MRLGLFMMPLHPPTRTLGDYMAETAEKVLLAERLGFDEVFVGEHFSATTEPIPSPLMFMASMLPQTSRIVFGTGVINLPNRHPAVIAAEVAQFDHMAQGRFIFGIGTGSLPSDYELFDVADVGKRNRMMIESMDIIERIWAQDPPYEIDGEFWKFGIRKAINDRLGIGHMPKPRQPGGPPVCVAVSSPNSSTVRVAAQRGWGPISSALAPHDVIASHWHDYAEARARPGGRRRRRLARRVLCRRRRHRCGGARARVRARKLLPLHLRLSARGARPRRPARQSQAAPRHARRGPDRRHHHRGPRALRLAADRGVEADRLPQPRRAVRHAAGDRRRLGRPNGAWGREFMHRLAEEVMPIVRRHAPAQAAE